MLIFTKLSVIGNVEGAILFFFLIVLTFYLTFYFIFILFLLFDILSFYTVDSFLHC